MVWLDGLPWLDERHRITFPDPPKGQEIAAVGGNLSPGMLLSAYEQGLFPWYNEEDPLLWWNPLQRMVIPVGSIHIPRRMKRLRRNFDGTILFDHDFPAVISACASIPRDGQEGTWIHEEMIDAYSTLHRLGYAHSAACYREGRLLGGLYGVSLGGAFFGESMFSREADASKLCLYALHDCLKEWGFHFIDCQLYTPHLERMGSEHVSRQQFSRMLGQALEIPTRIGSWANTPHGKRCHR